jgi:hypothetical protein
MFFNKFASLQQRGDACSNVRTTYSKLKSDEQAHFGPPSHEVNPTLSPRRLPKIWRENYS